MDLLPITQLDPQFPGVGRFSKYEPGALCARYGLEIQSMPSRTRTSNELTK